MFRLPSSLMIRNLRRTIRQLPRQAEACSNQIFLNKNSSQCTLSSLSGNRLLSTTTTTSDSKGDLATSSSTAESSSSSSGLLVKKIVELQDRDFLHHGRRPRFRDYEKFKSPRKRASKMLLDLNNEAMENSKTSNPAVWETQFRVGDAIELEVISQGGIPQKGSNDDVDNTEAADVAAAAGGAAATAEEDKDKKKNQTSQPQKNRNLERMRGVVLGIFRKKMDTAVLIRDVLFGLPIERRIPLHSPLIQSLRVLEKNFVFKGKKKIKRAKLYYLSERNPLLTQVTGTKKWKREK